MEPDEHELETCVDTFVKLLLLLNPPSHTCLHTPFSHIIWHDDDAGDDELKFDDELSEQTLVHTPLLHIIWQLPPLQQSLSSL